MTYYMYVASLTLWASSLVAAINRWDTGQVIPGTEGIVPGPGVNLSAWNTQQRNLRFADFRSVDLSAALLRMSWLDNADFSQANLTSVSLPSATLANANLRDANLTSSQARSAFLNDVDLTNANLTNVNLSEATLTRANLTGALITRANFSGTTTQGFTKDLLYSTASYRNKNLRGVNLANNNLNGWNFRNQDLTDAVLTGTLIDADLTGAIVTDTSFSQSLTKEQLYSTASYKQKNLQRIGLNIKDLTGFDFHDQDLSGAGISRSTLTNTDFSNANLFGANLGNSIGFSPSPSTITRNAILPNSEIRGLDVRTGESLRIHVPGLGETYSAAVAEGFIMAEGGTIEISLGSVASSRLFVHREVTTQLGGTLRVVKINRSAFTAIGATASLFDWPTPLEPGNVFSGLELPSGAWDLSQLYETGKITLLKPYGGDGDFDANGILNSSDIDRLTGVVLVGRDVSYDVNGDQLLNDSDRDGWIHEMARTYYGDSNLDREFNSRDLVEVFSVARYESSEAATWSQGDWNGDGLFSSGDLVAAFIDGGYERGRIAAVPETIGSIWILLGAGMLHYRVQRRKDASR